MTECCNFGTGTVSFTEPQKGFLIADECAGQRQIPMPVAANQVWAENQLLSINGAGELVSTDADPANFFGFSTCAWDGTAATPDTGGASVWVEGQFDRAMAVFATTDAATAFYRLRELGIHLRNRL